MGERRERRGESGGSLGDIHGHFEWSEFYKKRKIKLKRKFRTGKERP